MDQGGWSVTGWSAVGFAVATIVVFLWIVWRKGRPFAPGLADLLWAVMMTPDFQLIY